ncbi:MAG TPA: CARDB domain-containing protein [Actinomycetota bacterium]|nr:CARDB domain-containing protein [Actinomycetota bacterium]
MRGRPPVTRAAAIASLPLLLALLLPTTASAGGKPDLVVTRTTAPASGSVGGRLSVRDVVKNKGTAKAGASTVTYRLSTDRRASSDDLKLRATRSVSSLGAGKSSGGTTRVTVPDTTTPGAYYVVACADGKKKIAESNERNNCTATSATTDITPPPTSFDLIDAAEQSGAITHETALTYDAFAIFGDPRLPSRYAADNSGAIDSDALAEIAAEWQTLSPEAQQTLAPFFVPPMYDTSWMNAPAAGSTGDVTAAAFTDPCQTAVLQEDWSYIDGAHARIWYDDPEVQDYATAINNEIDATIWSKLQDVGMGSPPQDGGSSAVWCRGGSDNIDIVIADGRDGFGPLGMQGQTIPYIADDATTCPQKTFVMLNRFSGMNAGIVAHELFHAIQSNYSVDACRSFYQDYDHWMSEATATWIIDYIYPEMNIEHQFIANVLGRPAAPLNAAPNGIGHLYGAYIWWFFLQHTQGNAAATIKATYDNIAGGSLKAMSDALGGLGDLWADFVVKNWNRDPFNDYETWDGIADRVQPQTTAVTIDAGKHQKQFHPGADELFWLDAWYDEYDFSDPSVREFKFEHPPSGAGTKVQALLEVDGKWERQTWTGEKTLCRENPKEDVSKVVLIYSSSSIDMNNETSLKGTTLTASDMCHRRFAGDITYHYTYDNNTSIWAGGTGEHHVVSDVTMHFAARSDPDGTFGWVDDGTTMSLTGSTHGFDDSGHCRYDYETSGTASGPPLSAWTFFVGETLQAIQVFPEHATLSGTGITTKEDPDAVCENGSSPITDAPWDVSGFPDCDDATMTTDADGKATITFHDDEDVGTYGHRTCSGTITEL